jgi:spermidine synthase
LKSRFPLLLIFFLSGISALIYQVVWLKYLGLIFGNTVYAAATLIAVYLAGLGIGGALFGRRARKWDALIVYAILEALIGLLGALSPNAFALLDDAYIRLFRSVADAPLLLAAGRAVVVALFLLPPTILMGGTLPVLVRRLGTSDGTAVSSLYAANTFGAAAGVALSGFYTIPRFGLLMTIFFAVLLNFALALSAALFQWTGRRHGVVVPPAPAEPLPNATRISPRFVLAASLLMGLTSIADEVFWSRIFVLHLGSSVYAYAVMLFAFLLGIAIGSALIYRFIARIDAVQTLAMLEIALAVALALQIHYLTRFSSVLESMARLAGTGGYDAALAALLFSVLTAIVIPTTIMGATFPLTVRLFEQTRGESESRTVGTVYFANTIGAILGSLLSGFILIRLIGSQNGLFLMAAINLAVGILLGGRRLGRVGRRLAGVAAAVLAIAFFTARPNAVLLSAGIFDTKAPMLIFREDVTATVSLRQLGPDFLSLELNGVNVAGTSPDLIGTQKLQGHLPLLLHPGAKRVMHIGFGSGGTAYAVSLHPVEQIRIVEISPEVLEISGKNLRALNHGVLEDPRVHAEINDGRNFVLASPETFDVLLSDSIHPRYAGNGSLYTKDYFELCRRRLNPNGVVSMWLPIYAMTPRNYLQVLRAFADVFPNTTVWYVTNSPNPFTIVIGRTEPGPISLARMRAQLTPRVRAELAPIDIRSEYDLAGALLLDPQGVAAVTRGIDAHTDDVPTVEYESGRVIDRDGAWFANFTLLGRAMSPLPRAFQDGDPALLAQVDALRRKRYLDHWKLLREGLKR